MCLDEPERFVERPLTRLVVGEKYLVARVSVTPYYPIDQRLADPGSLLSRPDENILEIADRNIVGGGSGQPDQLAC